MLTHHVVTSSTNAKQYYGASVSPGEASTRRDYYAEGQESPGTYGGKLAEVLGLAGKPVDQETFFRLCDNLHPLTGRKLKPRDNDFSRVCYDFTVSGPKSFSIVEAFASEAERQRLRTAFNDAAVELVSGYMEPDMQCRERRGGASHDIATGNALTVAFPHATARPEEDGATPDPHWHQHLLVWNMTQRADGKMLAGQFGNLIRDKPYYRAVFYSLLAKKLEGLGYAIDRRGDVDWEIAGITQPMIDKFSKRTRQIDAEAEKRGITDAGRKAELGAEIRSGKQKDRTLPELREEWYAQLTSAERDALAAVYGKEIVAAREVTATEAVAYAIADLSEKLSVFPEREVKRVALLFGLGSLTPEQVAAELPRQGVITGTIDGREMATTQELQREEDYIVGQAMGGRGRVAPVGVAEGLSRTMANGKTLNDGQWDAVCGLLNSQNRTNLLEGPAGAGKSSLLRKFSEGMDRAGQSVTWLGTTAPAVGVLEKDGFKADTVARFLLDSRMQAAARHGHVVVDETSLLGHKDAVKLFKLAETLDLKLTFLGDPMQHGAVARGALMRILKDYGGIQPFKLYDILRQENPDYRAAAKLLSEGKTVEGFDAIDGMGRVNEIADDTDRNRHIAADYLQALDDRKSVLVVSPTHAESRSITAAIREELRAAKCIEGEDREFTRLVPVDATEAARGQAATYRVGDVIQFHQNAKGGYVKGDRLTVTSPSAVPLSEAARFSLYRPEKIALAEGDKLRFTATVKTLDGEHTIKNGAVRSVAEITPGGNLRLDNGWLVGKDAGHFRHGYVETSFGSQGRTVDRVILGMSTASMGAMNMEQLYVSASRAKEWIRLYTDSKADIREAVQRSSQKLAALDLPKPKADVGHWDGLQQHMERRKRLGLIHRMRSAWDRVRPGREKQKDRQNERQADYGHGR
jgi:conjugative relaxase-like TrwC/TraI family protein